jgi:hypothetical protein
LLHLCPLRRLLHPPHPRFDLISMRLLRLVNQKVTDREGVIVSCLKESFEIQMTVKLVGNAPHTASKLCVKFERDDRFPSDLVQHVPNKADKRNSVRKRANCPSPFSKFIVNSNGCETGSRKRKYVLMRPPLSNSRQVETEFEIDSQYPKRTDWNAIVPKFVGSQ